MIIIPAIDIIGGKCVRLTKGDYNQVSVYNENPLEVAKEFEAAGLKRLHLVDLDGAKTGTVKNWKVLDSIAGKTDLMVDFSGGISTQKDVQISFESGAAYVAVGSIAVTNEPELSNWLQLYKPGKFIIGADVKNEKIAIRGWTETVNVSLLNLIEKYISKGVSQFFCTDITKDGALQGPSVQIYKKIINAQPAIKLIASGGVTSITDLEQLKETGCAGAIVGKALYEKRISLNELTRYILNAY